MLVFLRAGSGIFIQQRSAKEYVENFRAYLDRQSFMNPCVNGEMRVELAKRRFVAKTIPSGALPSVPS
jgi:hypothetical protein